MNLRSIGLPSLLVVALASAVASVSPAPAAQTMRINPAIMVQHDEQSLQEHVNQLVTQMQALQTQLAADEAKIKQADDTANQAKFMTGLLNVDLNGQAKSLNASIEGVQANVDDVKASVDGVQAGLASTNAALGDLSTRYASHTHQFNSFTFVFHNDGSVTDGQYHVKNTQPPNN